MVVFNIENPAMRGYRSSKLRFNHRANAFFIFIFELATSQVSVKHHI